MTSPRVLKLLLVSTVMAVLMGTLAGRPEWVGAQDPQKPAKGAAAQAHEAQAAPAGYVGNEVCAGCHEDAVKGFVKNPHAMVEKSPHFSNVSANSCESCHGPGEAHVQNDGDKTKIIGFKGAAKKSYDEQCLACHGKNQYMMGFHATRHAKSGISCSDCHRVHSAARMTPLLAQPTNALCMGCHVHTRGEFSKPYHHRVREGAMVCTDCHNSHSGIDRRQIRTANFGEGPCYKCHSEKTGPYVFEHAPLRIRDCQACHQPHGSNNPRMLVRSTVRSLCLECHTNTSRGVLGVSPPAFHDVRSPRFQNCTTCHVKVHGSNYDRFFFR